MSPSRLLLSGLAAALSSAVLSSAVLTGASARAGAPDPWAGIPQAVRPLPGTPTIAGVWRIKEHVTALKTLDGQDPPLLPAARAEYERRKAALKADPSTDPVSHCWMQGVPRLLYAPYPVLILQERDRVNFVHQANHTFRVVSLKRPLPKDSDLDPLWLGYSAGRWEGKTLVIDTIGFNDKTWLDYSGLPHSEALKVEERYTLKDPDTLEGRVTITDPETFSRPWTAGFTLVRQPGLRLKESVCVRDHEM